VKFGPGIRSDIPGELKAAGAKRPVIVTDKGLIAAGVVDKVLEALKEGGFTDVPIYDHVEPNPRDLAVEEGAVFAKEVGADSFVAIGGGSSMDTAKIMGVILNHGGKVKDYEGLDAVPGPTPFLIAVPTTVGTGSEVTFWAVIKDTKENYKLSIGSSYIAPDVAIADPELIETLPPKIIAATGMDALTHAIEGYTCRIAEPITDAAGLYAIELISNSIIEAVYVGDEQSRANMLIGSLIAGICFGNSDVGGGHCMSEALGGLYDTPHGIANAVILPYIMEYNCLSDIQKFKRVSIALGVNIDGLSDREAAFASIDAVRQLNDDLAIPTIREIGTKEEDLEELSYRSATNVSVEDNPRVALKEDFYKIFRKAMDA
jgi:alcohol dehydrogenase